MSCGSCGESRFSNSAQLQCHETKNHAEFSCPCDKKFMTKVDLEKHSDEMKSTEKASKCSTCCRSFNTGDSQHEHQRSKGHWQPGERDQAQETSGRHYCDDQHCGRSFKTDGGLKEHVKYRSSKDGRVCVGCTKTFPDKARLNQHQKDTAHTSKNQPGDQKGARKEYIDNFYKEHVAVDKTDKKESVAVVKSVVDQIHARIREMDGGKIYSTDVKKAGSHAMKAKIGKADEFDTNIPLNLKTSEIRTSGKLPYAYEKNTLTNGPSPSNMNVAGKLVDVNRRGHVIPNGHACVKVDDKVPGQLKHKEDLLPREIKRDYHSKVDRAIKDLGFKGVHLSRNAHGPAVTLTINPRGNVKHDISVDLTLSIPCDKVKVTENGWPRPDTRKAFSEKHIEAIKDAGIHLVPKFDATWAKSYSNAEKTLLRTIDEGNGCRRQVLKCMKRHAQVCGSGPEGLPGFSSHILKHQVLWSSENRRGEDYWHARNVDRCLMDTMKDTEHALRAGKLPNYFNTSENILKDKDRAPLNRMADHLKQERNKLTHM